MLNNQPVGDLWNLQDNDAESQHYGKTFHFDFSYIHSEEMKSVVKDYVWQNWKTGSKVLNGLYKEINRIRHFAEFAAQHKFDSFRELDNTKVDLFLSYLRTVISSKTKKPLSYISQKNCLTSVKSIIAWCRIHRPEAAPAVEIFTGNEFTGINRRMKVDFIPDEVMAQINIALKAEENPYLKYGIVILESTGMRLGDLLKLRTDCINPHLVSGYTISWFDHKNRRERPPMPVRIECAHAVQKLIEITEPLRAEADDSIKDMLFIHRCTSKNPKKHAGQVVVPTRSAMSKWLKYFVKKNHILDADGTPYNLTAHQFRRTLGTDMLSKGTDLNVIQQVLGHSDPSVTKRFYADVKDKERAETFKNIGIIGNIDLIDDSSFESAAEKDWFQANKHKGAALCDGYCTKPFDDGKVCDRLLKRHKCYSCSRYITTPEYLQAHRDHLARLEKQLKEGAIYGEHYAEHFRPTMEVLKVIIERLEELQNGRNESGLTVTGR